MYYGGVNGTMKAFLDRLFFAGADVRHKVGAAVVSPVSYTHLDVYKRQVKFDTFGFARKAINNV